MPKAIKHFTTQEIEAFIDGGDGGDFLDLLTNAVKEAKDVSDGVATVQFFVDYEPEEEEEEEDDPDARRQQKIDDERDEAIAERGEEE